MSFLAFPYNLQSPEFLNYTISFIFIQNAISIIYLFCISKDFLLTLNLNCLFYQSYKF